MIIRASATGVALLLAIVLTASADEPLRIYLDADQTLTREAGLSIQLGMQSALDELGGTLGGHPVEIVVRDHRGNSRRSRKHLEAFVADDRALAVFCGLHSPPVLAALDYIHGNEILMLDPWAAAGPITRGDYEPNWIFRLSVDDTKAGGVISNFVTETLESTNPHLLLERTGWGRSNEATMKAALAAHGIEDPKVHWFDWGIQRSGADHIAQEIIRAKADAVMLVANAPEGRMLLAALARQANERAPAVASHWGIAGGSMASVYPPEVADRVSLALIQTGAVDLLANPNTRVRATMDRAIERYPELAPDGRIAAAVGFVHAHDLMLLLDAAMRQAGPRNHVRELRAAARDALEALETPVSGLLRDYTRPFAAADEGHADAHEALGTDDFRMHRVERNGAMVEIR